MAEDSPITQLLHNWRAENPGHTLQATALVNEAILKLVDTCVSRQSRAHFIAIATRAKSNKCQKRGGDEVLVTLHETIVGANDQQPNPLDTENALNKLAAIDPRKAKIIEHSFFGGMTHDEIAEALDISAATMDRELRFSRDWLQKELTSA